jgi:hypothetical protein
MASNCSVNCTISVKWECAVRAVVRLQQYTLY